MGVLGLLYKLYFGVTFFIILLCFYPIFTILLSKEKWHFRAFRVMKICSIVIQMCTFMYTTKNRRVKSGHPQIICSNHSSYLDIVLMYSTYHRPFLFLGKSELLKWPLIGQFFKKMNIAVDRNNVRAATQSLEKGRQKLKEGWSIVIFPEGTIPVDVPKIMRFKNGAFKLAIEEQVPIQPITFLNHWKLMSDPSETFGVAHPGLGKAIIHDEVSTEGLTQEDLVTLRQQVYAIIDAPNQQYNAQALADLDKKEKNEN